MDRLGLTQLACRCVEALHGHPVRLGCQPVIDQRRLFEVLQVSFLEVALQVSVITCRLQPHQAVRLEGGQAQVDHQLLRRQAVDAVFETLQPREELLAALRADTRRLVGQVRADVAVGENGFPLGDRPNDDSYRGKL